MKLYSSILKCTHMYTFPRNLHLPHPLVVAVVPLFCLANPSPCGVCKDQMHDVVR